jgi:Ca-activated chloride channel family protein
MRLRTTLWAIVFLLAGAMLLAQGPRRDAGAGLPAPPPGSNTPKDAQTGKPIAIDVDLVNFDVVVADKNNTLIGGLEKRDFKVFDDGVEQTITSFSANETPLTVVVMFEFSKTLVYYLDDVFTPIAGFVRSLQDDDWVALVKVDLHTEIMSDFTKNKNQIYNGLADLRFATYDEVVLFDAVDEMLGRLEKIDGKKAIFLVATGIDTISKHTYGEVLKHAEGSDVAIYSVSMGQLYRLYTENSRSAFNNIGLLAADNQLRSLSEATGGQAFYPRFQTEYPDIYDNISKQLRHQYSIGFVPANLKRDGKFHKLRVDVTDLDLNKDGKKDGLKARHKKGYYAPKS